jgi:hypothetical protein
MPFTQAMPGDRQHLLLRHRRLRNWAALIAVVALLAWTVEYASHLHVNQEAQLTSQSSHFCELCAAFEAGASMAATAFVVPKLPPLLIRVIAAVAFPRLQIIYSYRSRAPPRA